MAKEGELFISKLLMEQNLKTKRDQDQYYQQRLKKLKEHQEKTGQFYPNHFKPQNQCGLLVDQFGELSRDELEKQKESFSICGRVMARRVFGKAGFLQVKDASGKLQVFCQKNTLSEDHFIQFKALDVGDIIFCEGELFRTKTDELSLKAQKLELVTKSLQTLPEKWHGLTDVEVRYRKRYLDLIANPKVSDVFIKRSQIVQAIRRFFEDKGFLEVETPMMHPIAGGAKAKPFQTHHNQLDRELFLRIAPELYLKRLIVGGFEKVFELNRNFRNEGVSIQHNPEFTMLEFYQAYATFTDLMDLTEELLRSLVLKLNPDTKLIYQDQEIDFGPSFMRLKLSESLVTIGGLSAEKISDLEYLKEQAQKLKNFDPTKLSADVGSYQAFLFEELVEAKLIQPTFITHFPVEVSPLSRRNDQDSKLADRFELFIYGREIANAFSELNDPKDQEERFLNQVRQREAGDDEAMHFDEDYINALEYGMPPTAGEGIGIDRLVMLLTNQASIRDVILFPQLKS